MGNGFLLDWKWVFPIQSNFLSISSSSSSRQQSSSLRGKETSFESAKMSTLSLIPEESETRYKDSLKQYICPDGALQSIESSYAATQGMKMNIGEKEACVDSHNAFCDINMPVLVDNSVHLVSSTSDNNTHFNLLMKNLKEIEETFADSDSELTNLERIRSTLEERIGRGASLTSWARAAGIDEKVLQQCLHFGWHCRDNLLKSARSLVLYIARNYRRRGISLEDLLQAGNMGVLQGAERFDHTRGYRFSTYVQYWIRKSMSSLIAQHSKGIKIPVTLNDIIDQMKKARRSLYKSNGTFPRDAEIAKLAGVSVASIRLANKCSRAMGSIDQKIGDCMHVKFKEFTPDTTLKTPEEVVMKQHMQKELQELLEHLHPRERQVLVLRFGLEDGNRRSLEEIGILFHVSKEWIRKIEKAALTKVRNEELKTRLKHYVEY